MFRPSSSLCFYVSETKDNHIVWVTDVTQIVREQVSACTISAAAHLCSLLCFDQKIIF